MRDNTLTSNSEKPTHCKGRLLRNLSDGKSNYAYMHPFWH